MIPAYKKRTTIAGVAFLAAYIAATIAASAANPRDPGLGIKVAPLLAMVGGIALLCAVWFYIKAKGRSGWWILLLALNLLGLVILAFLPDRGTPGEEQVAQQNLLPRFLSHIALSSAQLVVAVVAVFGIYLGWMWWEGRQLQSLCAEANEGVPVAALPALAEKYGFDRRWVEHGIRDKDGLGGVTYVPSSSTMGDVVCAIHFNESRVLSARMGQ